MVRKRFAVVAAALTLLALVSISAVSAPKEIRIAVCGPMTGDYAQYGQSFKRGSELMAKLVNEAGGVNGAKIKIEIMDDKNEQKEGINVAQRLVSDKGIVAVVGHFASGVCLATAPVYQRGGLVQASPTSSHPDFTKQGTYMFRNCNTQEVEGPAGAEFIINQMGKKNIAVIYINNDWGLTAKDCFVKGVKDRGGRIVAAEPFIGGQTRDFTPMLTKINAAKPDIIYLAAMYADAGMIAQQLKRLGYGIEMFGNSSVYNQMFIDLAGSAVDDVFLTASFFAEEPAPEVQTFVSSFKKEYGIIPDQFAALAYDTTGVVIEALKVSGPDRAKLRDALAHIKDYPGVTGNTTFDENRDAKKGVLVLKIENGKFVFHTRV